MQDDRARIARGCAAGGKSTEKYAPDIDKGFAIVYNIVSER